MAAMWMAKYKLRAAWFLRCLVPARRASGWLGLHALWLLLACFAAQVSAADSPPVSEYALKAAFLFNFAKFITWPGGPDEDPRALLVIGVCGSEQLTGEIAALLQGRTIGSRVVKVTRVAITEEAASSNLLFVSAVDEGRCRVLQAQVRDRPVVTVGESASFAAADGMITFVREGDKLRFEINSTAAERAGLKFSAQLLKLATVVHR
jgi:hypothetical protein